MVDAVGSITKIVGVALRIKEAVNTVHQNKKDCHHIKSRVDILNKTLSHHENNAELMEDSAVMAALVALDGILAEALEIITECQAKRTIVCVYCTAGKLSRQLSKVEQRISNLSSDAMLTIMSYLLLMKSQEGAPHPPHQIYALDPPLQPPSLPEKVYGSGTQTPLQEPSPRQKVPKFGSWDAADHTDQAGCYQTFGKRRRPNYSVLKLINGDREAKPSIGLGHTSCEYASALAVKNAIQAYINHDVPNGVCPTGAMVGEPPSLVHRIAEVAGNIKEALETVLKNRDECVEIAKRVSKVGTLLSQLEDTKMADEPAMRGTLEKLLVTFIRGHTLVIACQSRRGLAIVWLSTPPGRLSRQLHEVLDQMASNIADMTAIVLP